MFFRKTFSTSVLGLALAISSGCAGVNSVSDATNLINSKLKSATDAVNNQVGSITGKSDNDWRKISERTDYTNINDTKIFGIFRENPFKEEIAPQLSYPRVALIVHSVPKNHNNNYLISVPGLNKQKMTIEEYEEVAGCWNLSATVWENSNNSEVIDFGWCYPDDMNGSVYGKFVNNWKNMISLAGPEGGHTGRDRTTGPLPPKDSFPDNLAHRKFLSDLGGTYDILMLGSIMDAMSFDYTINDDKRFWVVRFDQAQ